MKVDNIIIGKQISKHLHHFEQDIQPEDLLKIIRFLACKGRELGYLYNKNQIYYTESDSITRQEFEYVYKHTDKKLDYLLDRYTRDDLVNTVGSALKIISSTTKTEMIQKIVEDKNLFFRFFKRDLIEKYCSKWREFKRQKVFMPSVSDNKEILAFALGCRCAPLSGEGYLQYWRLGDKYNSFELNRNIKTEIIGDNFTINLKDSHELILRTMYKFLERNDDGLEFHLSCESRAINTSDLEIKKADAISYTIGLFNLVEHFGMRKGSKFKTFSQGLKQKTDSEIVEQYLGKKFIIASDNHHIYCGVEYSREFFEKIAWHLKIEYLKDKKVLCTVIEEETQETITALWDILSESKYTSTFCFIEV